MPKTLRRVTAIVREKMPSGTARGKRSYQRGALAMSAQRRSTRQSPPKRITRAGTCPAPHRDGEKYAPAFILREQSDIGFVPVPRSFPDAPEKQPGTVPVGPRHRPTSGGRRTVSEMSKDKKPMKSITTKDRTTRGRQKDPEWTAG